MTELKVVGKALPRIDGPEKVTGRTVYAADMQLPGMLHAKVLRCPYPHALIKRIDTSKAKAYPGVVAVVTADDLPPADRDPSVRSHAVLVEREAIFEGQAVAAVAAETPYIAEEALDLIEVEYEELPAVLDPEEAIKPDAPPTRRPLDEIDVSEIEGHVTVDISTADDAEAHRRSPNISNRLHFVRGNVEKGFEEADIIVEGRFDSKMAHQAYLEPQACVAHYDATGKLTIWTPTQGQFYQRNEIARILGLPHEKINLVGTEVGGGFGAKVAPLIQPLTALLSMKTGRPVKLVLTRREDLMNSVPAPRGIVEGKIGATKDGRLTTFKARIIFDSGAFPAGTPVGATMMIAACYKFDHLDVEGIEVLTNKCGAGAYRAPGMPEVTFAIEQLVDEVCRQGGFDPIELRKKNVCREGDLMPNGRPWPKIGLYECLEALENSELWRTRHQTKNGGKPRGVGVAIGAWPGGMQPASALVKMNENGTFKVVVGSNDISGVNTSFTMIAAEELGVPMHMVTTVTADTDTAPYGGLAAGSKTLYSGGKSVQAAAQDARRQILAIASRELDANPEDLVIEDGVVFVPGTDKKITFQRIAALTMGFGSRYAPVVGRGGEVIRNQAPGTTAQAVEIELDPETGNVTVTRAAVAQDVGKAINRLSIIGQMEGGVTQCLGMGLTEELIFDERGKMRNPVFLDYRLLTALDVPRIETLIVEVPSPEGPFGARIAGEPSIIAGSAAIANALRDATGLRFYEAPMTPERVLRTLRKAGTAVSHPVVLGEAAL
ncbi:MAG: xanthine dehydrogenase family protein molybdopterin-binding subunit [Chloroflexota bacterium]|nr:xanthine dehydrogenase family protein molybdopterin-binding subunit [Dehalococcoidia bacterium]MDW8254774.1 xanthine dehydrogenase family protein molybdopterin-binding subunit [Chloroflexota bacterium]